jgi:single-stranded-DNA-specific exonuclease
MGYSPFMKKLWHKLTPDAYIVQKISNALMCHPLTASVLVNRNIFTPEDANRFLNTSLADLRPPFAMKDLDAAVCRIIKAITSNEKILIFGDYDTDGVTATTMVLEFLRHTGSDTIYYIPHRTKEGYSLQPDHISGIVTSTGAKLIITVDCGSASHAAVANARRTGIDVIVVDHHNIASNVPSAVAVINPKRRDCQAGFENLSGAGVAFFLIIALRKQLRDRGFWENHPEPNLKRFCDLVALGTVADMVPLLNENRILTQVGLEEIRISHRSGIKALMKVSGLTASTVNEEDIAFKLAPRLNSAGRMDHADIAVQLLTANETARADKIADRINNLNTSRQAEENRLLTHALNDLEKKANWIKKRSLVLFYHNWNEGILGIIAARLAKRFYRPVVLISIKAGEGKGSARSIPGFDLYQGLAACSDLLTQFGGHPMAAGLTLDADQIDRFKEKFETTVQKMTSPEDFVPRIMVDYDLSLDEVSDNLIDEIQRLRPFGAGNSEPVFLTQHVRIVDSKIVGQNHRQMILKSAAGQKALNAIQFNINPQIPLKTHYDQVLFKLSWNYWNRGKTPQLIVEDMSF